MQITCHTHFVNLSGCLKSLLLWRRRLLASFRVGIYYGVTQHDRIWDAFATAWTLHIAYRASLENQKTWQSLFPLHEINSRLTISYMLCGNSLSMLKHTTAWDQEFKCLHRLLKFWNLRYIYILIFKQVWYFVTCCWIIFQSDFNSIGFI